MFRNNQIQSFLENLGPQKEQNYSLWKASSIDKVPTNSFSPLRKDDGSWAQSDSEKGTILASHLSNVFKPNPKQIDFEPVFYTPETVSHPPKVTFEELKETIDNINIKKAPGYDKISGKMIKNLPFDAIWFLLTIFNHIFAIGHYPKPWKVSLIKMIPKPGKDPTVASSYRPISLLSLLSKVFEKIVISKIQPFLDDHHCIPDHQFGFRKKHGTIEQVHRIAQEIHNAFNDNKYCAAVFLDVAQAFDKVWHEGLLHKIKLYLPENTHKLLRSYIKYRKFRLSYNTFVSREFDIQAGVPQGSVLGPLLYLIYTADLPQNPNTLTSTFADDTAIISCHYEHNVASKILSTHLRELEGWLRKWRVKVNESKSTHITFTLKRKTCPAIYLNGTTIPQKDVVKYLGIHLDRRLTWKPHIDAKITQARLKTLQLNWLINQNSNLSLTNKVLLYNTVIKPIWMYGMELWSSACASSIERFQRLQNKILRMICGAPWYMKTIHIHKDLNVPMVSEVILSVIPRYKSKLRQHPNPNARNLLVQGLNCRLKRNKLLPS